MVKITYKLKHRRHRDKKTDYRHRLKILRGRKLRFVVRKSLNNILCQIIEYLEKGDKVIISADSKELKKFGWKAHRGNIPSAYLTGFLCGLKCKNKKIDEAVFDMGLYTSTKGSRLYGALNGAIDAGLKIPFSKEILGSSERITGKHIADYATKLKKENVSKYKKIFASYLKNKIEPENLQKHFEDTKKKILSNFNKK